MMPITHRFPLLLAATRCAVTKFDADGELPTCKRRHPVDRIARNSLELVDYISLRGGKHSVRRVPQRFDSLEPRVCEVQLRILWRVVVPFGARA